MSQEEWIYLDETLPEIHVREIISIEELLEENPNFVALSDEEIYNNLLVIFENRTGIANSYFELHKEITVPKDLFERYYKHVVYYVNARRKQYDTQEAVANYFDTLESLKRNPNYETREKIKNELYDPFEADDEIENEDTIPIPTNKKLQIEVAMHETLRLKTDKEKYDIIGGDFRKASHVDEMYMAEHIRPGKTVVVTEKYVRIAELGGSESREDLFDKFTKSLVPSFKYILDHIDQQRVSDIHSLQLLFQSYGRDLEEIDIETYHKLAQMLKDIPSDSEESEIESEEEPEKEKKRLHFDTLSDVKIHGLFWKSMLSRLLIAKDVPIYSDIINNAIATVLSKAFKADMYVPVAEQLEKLEKGSLTLGDFIKDIQLLRQFNERNLMAEFRKNVEYLQNEDVFKELEERIQRVEELFQKTIDPDKAEEKFGTKSFLQDYKEIEEIRSAIQVEDETLEPSDMDQTGDGGPVVEEYVPVLPEYEEDVEPEEEEDQLMQVLEKYEEVPLISILREIHPILTELQKLTKMPWDPEEFVKILIQRAPPVIDIGVVMMNIDNTIRADIIETIRNKSFDDAVDILPIEQHMSLKNTYQKALKELKNQKVRIFFMFMSYWTLFVQKQMIDDLFVLKDINDTPCKSDLKGIGYPIVEGREGKNGVMNYFTCILHEEGHEILGIQELIDEYSKKQLEARIKEGFDYFAHEIEEMQQQSRREVVYEGQIASEEALQAYNTIQELRERQFRPQELLKPYIKSIQLLPSIMGDAKERHKHILGCCQSQLNSEYQAKRNLPKRFKGPKNYFARERVGNKARPPLIYYGKPSEPIEFKAPEKEEDTHFSAPLEEPDEEWRDKIRTLAIFSTKVRQILNKENNQEVEQLKDEALRYLNALYRTINRSIGKDMWRDIRNLSRSELVGMITQACYDLYKFTVDKQDTYAHEIPLIRDAIKKTNDAIEILKELQIPEGDYAVFYSLLQYILCCTLCYPGDVKPNMRKITIERVVKAKFIEDVATHMEKQLRGHMDARATPTIEEIEKRISEIREKRKMETIDRFEQNRELEKLVKQAKLQGIKIDVDTADMEPTTVHRHREDEIADYEGAREFEMPTQDPDEMNPDAFGDL